MSKINQKGVFNPQLLIALAVIGVLAFIVFANSASFQNKLFGSLYPKSQSEAKGPNQTPSTTASLVITPNPAAPSSIVRVTGAGYDCSTWVEVREVDASGQVVAAYTGAVYCDGGKIDFNFTLATSTGTMTMKAYQNLGKGRKKNLTLVAQTTLVVQ